MKCVVLSEQLLPIAHNLSLEDKYGALAYIVVLGNRGTIRNNINNRYEKINVLPNIPKEITEIDYYSSSIPSDGKILTDYCIVNNIKINWFIIVCPWMSSIVNNVKVNLTSDLVSEIEYEGSICERQY